MSPSYLDKLQQILPRIHVAPGAGRLDMAAALEAHTLPADVSVRYNRRKIPAALPAQAPVPWCPGGYYLDQRPVFTLDPVFHAGGYYVQEASSMFVHHAFRTLVPDTGASLKVLDLCAAPGGKSTLIASLLSDDDLLVSNEVIQPRAAILAENLSRWGQMNTWVSHNDPKDFARLPGYFDVMLIDAPCTGSGLWRKDEAAADEWSEEHVKLCSERQRRILADALPALKAGGILLYATCSYSSEENEQVADWIIETQAMEALEIPVADAWHITRTCSEKHQAPGYRFYPWQLRGEGFFLSAFRKQAIGDVPGSRNKKNNKESRPKTKDETARWQGWLTNDFKAIERNGDYYAIPAALAPELEILQGALRIRKTGTALGKIAGKDMIPDQELALSVHLAPDLPRLPLDREEALLYLKKEEVRKDNPVKGWQLATFEGLGLGWGKWLPHRMNNYFPKNWRIRMDLK